MSKQPKTLEEIPEIKGLQVNRYFYNVRGVAKLTLDDGEEMIVYVAARTDDGRLICSHTSKFNSKPPHQRYIGSETECIEIIRIKNYSPIKGIL